MDETTLLKRITHNPQIFGGKPIIRGRRLAVEHVLGMLAAGDTADILLEGYPWLEPDEIPACMVFARRQAKIQSTATVHPGTAGSASTIAPRR